MPHTSHSAGVDHLNNIWWVVPSPQSTKGSDSKITKKQSTNYRTPLKIYHQNIRGLRYKTNELLSHIHSDLPQLLCFTEHHMRLEELQQVSMNEYKLAANFCRTAYAKGGVCMYVHKCVKFVNIQGVTGGTDQTSGGCSLCETIPKKPKTPISKVERFGR